VIHASRWGKHKTMWQIIAILAALIYLCVRDIFMLNGAWDELKFSGVSVDLVCMGLLRMLVYVCAFFTLLSGVIYLAKNTDLVRDQL
jgi:phosphatidylglycerophosphate synthase